MSRVESWDWEQLTPLQRLFSTLAAVGLQAGSLQIKYLIKLELPHGNLVGVRLAPCDLEAADLRGANLEGALLEGALLEGALLGPAGAAELRSFVSTQPVAPLPPRDALLAAKWDELIIDGQPVARGAL